MDYDNLCSKINDMIEKELRMGPAIALRRTEQGSNLFEMEKYVSELDMIEQNLSGLEMLSSLTLKPDDLRALAVLLRCDYLSTEHELVFSWLKALREEENLAKRIVTKKDINRITRKFGLGYVNFVKSNLNFIGKFLYKNFGEQFFANLLISLAEQ